MKKSVDDVILGKESDRGESCLELKSILEILQIDAFPIKEIETFDRIDKFLRKNDPNSIEEARNAMVSLIEIDVFIQFY